MIERVFNRKRNISLEDQVLSAQKGDEQTRNDLLKKYQPFIAKTVSQVCKKYIDPKSDDEFSIGLIAFDQAIQTYSTDKGNSFLSFAKVVVKRKVIDYLRSEQRKQTDLSIDQDYEDEEQMENQLEVQVARNEYIQQSEAWQRREEILEFQNQLREYKISFDELTSHSPKHADARQSAIEVAKIIFSEEPLRNYVIEKKRLPMKDLVDYVEVSRKTLERNRKYILAMFIILSGDYIYLKDYLKGVDL
ncbi:RNA polymerase sigma factor SigI [Virgibacillus sp. MSP4-1]|uniref:RNA polymerase sigma factor SigI n=1 Tax=Virgibacillus sp. MSP4-1 TaxID=2700081 RepID=UPI000399C8B1|nr:RNA polymerase sigma factor SigI [Virgibacillus sp. MSP4-1]QHS21554.1 RNA polymerase sigma factor SigI [Virgibacillus sp. MSP4-1]